MTSTREFPRRDLWAGTRLGSLRESVIACLTVHVAVTSWEDTPHTGSHAWRVNMWCEWPFQGILLSCEAENVVDVISWWNMLTHLWNQLCNDLWLTANCFTEKWVSCRFGSVHVCLQKQMAAMGVCTATPGGRGTLLPRCWFISSCVWPLRPPQTLCLGATCTQLQLNSLTFIVLRFAPLIKGADTNWTWLNCTNWWFPERARDAAPGHADDGSETFELVFFKSSGLDKEPSSGGGGGLLDNNDKQRLAETWTAKFRSTLFSEDVQPA